MPTMARGLYLRITTSPESETGPHRQETCEGDVDDRLDLPIVISNWYVEPPNIGMGDCCIQVR